MPQACQKNTGEIPKEIYVYHSKYQENKKINNKKIRKKSENNKAIRQWKHSTIKI